MSRLERIRRGGTGLPPRVVIYGDSGIGKSTWASRAPSPIFITTEDGLGSLDVESFPLATELADVRDAVVGLLEEPHDYRTVVIDSLDWLEQLVWRAVADEHNVASLEALPYGKGYVYAADKWRAILSALDELRQRRQMGVILIAHDKVRRHDAPLSEPYDRIQLKLHDRASALITEWCDVLGYATNEVIVRATDPKRQKPGKVVNEDRRVIHFRRSPAYDAKSRMGLPDTLPLDYAAFAAALASTYRPTKEMTDHAVAQH